MSQELLMLIIKDNYGPEYSKIAQVIYQHKKISLTELIHHTRMPFQDIRQILVIMIKNNLVSFQSSTPVNYELNIESIMSCLYYPFFIQHAQELFGDFACQIIENMLINNVYSLQDLLEQFQAAGESPETQFQIIQMFGKLVQDNYLVQTNHVDIEQELTPNIPKIINKKVKIYFFQNRNKQSQIHLQSSKKVKLDQIQEQKFYDDGLSYEILALLGQKKQQQNNLEIDNQEDVQLKNDDLYTLDHLFFTDPNTKVQILYKVNYRQFINYFRSQSIVEIVCEKINVQAASIVQAILNKSKINSKAFVVKTSEFFTQNQIKKMLPPNLNLDSDKIEKYLEILSKENIIVTSHKQIDQLSTQPMYAISLESITKTLQIKYMEQMIDKKFSSLHSRVVRILKIHKYLDDKQISDKSMLSLKETRYVCMELYKEGVLNMEQVNDEKNKQITIFQLKLQYLFQKTIDLMHKTLLNLKIQQDIVYQKLNSYVVVTDENQKQIDFLKNQILKIEQASLDISQEFMILNDY